MRPRGIFGDAPNYTQMRCGTNIQHNFEIKSNAIRYEPQFDFILFACVLDTCQRVSQCVIAIRIALYDFQLELLAPFNFAQHSIRYDDAAVY